MEKLPVEFKTKWVAALRSGEYKQCESQLHDRRDNKYCCLGVACAVTGVTIPEDEQYIPLDFPEVPDLIKGQTELTEILTDMNDWGQQSFSEIADYIEANL